MDDMSEVPNCTSHRQLSGVQLVLGGCKVAKFWFEHAILDCVTWNFATVFPTPSCTVCQWCYLLSVAKLRPVGHCVQNGWKIFGCVWSKKNFC